MKGVHAVAQRGQGPRKRPLRGKRRNRFSGSSHRGESENWRCRAVLDAAWAGVKLLNQREIARGPGQGSRPHGLGMVWKGVDHPLPWVGVFEGAGLSPDPSLAAAAAAGAYTITTALWGARSGSGSHHRRG